MVKENCGVVGIFSLDGINVIPMLIDSLRALQHRGQEAWGIAVPNKSPLKKLMAGMLNMCLKSPLPLPPFSVALDIALKIYWTGAVSSNMCLVVVPGVTGAFIDAEGIKNTSVDDFIDQLIKAFDTHSKQVQGIGVPLGTVPTVFTGYKVPGGA